VTGRFLLRALRADLDGETIRVAGLAWPATPGGAQDGAPPEDAAAALQAARRDGFRLALTVRDDADPRWGPAGFRALPAAEAACKTRLPAAWPREPDWIGAGDPEGALPGLRAAEGGDVAALVALREAGTGGQRFRVRRDAAGWRRILGAGGVATGERQVRVLDDGGGPSAYVVLQTAAGRLLWLEHGAGAGGGERLVDLFWYALALARRDGLPRLEGWCLPPAIEERRLYPVARRRRVAPVVLLAALDAALELPSFRSEAECRISPLDRP
jgi:hypothetical protein